MTQAAIEQEPHVTSQNSSATSAAQETYRQVKKVLEEIKPMAVSIEELMSLTEHPWTHRQIYDACKHGLQQGEFERDTSATPTKYRMTEQPAAAQEDLSPAAREKRKRGLLKKVVDYLAESGAHATADELVPQVGFATTKEKLSACLSNAFARGILKREYGHIPYKYFVSEKDRNEWVAKRKVPAHIARELASEPQEDLEQRMQEELQRQRQELEQQMKEQLEEKLAEMRVAPESALAEMRVAEPTEPAQPEAAPITPAARAPQPASAQDFHAALGWDNQLTLTLNGQQATIPAELTLKLARLLRPLMNS